MAGRSPGHPRLTTWLAQKTWMPGTRPGMTSPNFQSDSEIVWAEADHVHAGKRQDLFELIERAFGLDLGTGDGPIVGGGEIVPFMVEARAIRTPAAQPAGWKLDRSNEGLRILDTVD